jgi:predicted DsbA family dithiol-disulfide isomerase
MKIEIWSDIVCPFCYIGKRKFENALAQFEHRDKIEIKWKSFQLNPDMPAALDKNIYEYLAERKGWSVEQSRTIHDQMANSAKETGLDYNFDKTIPANTLNAHRLTHLASRYDLQDAVEERLFSAYFTEGKNINDKETLFQIGTEAGLPAQEIKDMLESDSYAKEVRLDEVEAQQIGVRGVPFFVLDRKYAVSGAQPSETFLQAIEQAWKEHENSQPVLSNEGMNGASCTIDGNC